MIATANPVEYEGTYPLPEAQLDRFLMRVAFGYPSRDQEWAVLQRRLERRQEAQRLDPVTDAAGLRAMQAAIETVTVEESVGRYCVALAAATRDHPQVLMGASPRGALALLLTARAFAVIAARDYVLPEDVKAVAPSVLGHRVTVRPELWMTDVTGAAVVQGCSPRSRRPAPARPGSAAHRRTDPEMARADGGWHPTAALVRAATASAAAGVAAVVAGRPDLLVLAAPLLVHAVAGARPATGGPCPRPGRRRSARARCARARAPRSG